MSDERLEIRKSPMVFLKRLISVEFFFALLPFVALALPNFRSEYESSILSGTVSYNFLLTIVMTTLQVLILAVVFVTWYVPVYQIDKRLIVQKRGELLGDRKIIDTPAVLSITLRQGWLARRLSYGTLVISSSTSPDTDLVRDIPNPGFHAERIQGLVVPETAPQVEFEPKEVQELIEGGENQYVEFKSSLMWDYRRQSANKDLYEPVMKNINGFLNTRGGAVIIGVDDAGEVLGLDPDLNTLSKSNVDGFENAFNMSFNRMIGVEFRRFVDVAFPQVGARTVCVVTVRPADQPAYLVHKGTERFFIRAGNASQPLSVSQATRYIQAHFS